jgi:hypothetical protein
MPSFRPAKKQAAHAVCTKIAFGQPRHENKDAGKIHSVRTAQSYNYVLISFSRFIKNHRLGDLKSATPEIAQAYLQERREIGMSQKALDQDRQAIQCHLNQKLTRVYSFKKTELTTRSYTGKQIREIVRHQNDRNSLSTEIAYATGLRGHELFTLRPIVERPASSHREWCKTRFTGRQGLLYTVVGKGGLCREVLIPSDLACRLEAQRYVGPPREVTDRGVKYLQLYDIGGGKSWSTSFDRVSESRFGWSTGGHGTRHSYAQLRMSELQRDGFTYNTALAIVAQEVGHFSPKTTEAYLR